MTEISKENLKNDNRTTTKQTKIKQYNEIREIFGKKIQGAKESNYEKREEIKLLYRKPNFQIKNIKRRELRSGIAIKS